MSQEKQEIWNAGTTVAEIASRTGISQANVKAVLDSFKGLVIEKVGKGDSFRFVGFGTFEKKHHNARKGRNPQTGKEIEIAASDKLGFHSNVSF